MRRWLNGHIGFPEPVAEVITGETLRALRQYFLGVTIVAAFNAIVIGLGALILGVPLAGTIAVVTFVGAYVPFIGAWVGGAFAVALALAGQGETAAIVMAVIVLLANGMLQQIVQPIAFGATLGLNPLVVLIATISGGCLFGMIGLILAAPLVSAGVHIAQRLSGARAAEAADGRPAEPEAAAGRRPVPAGGRDVTAAPPVAPPGMAWIPGGAFRDGVGGLLPRGAPGPRGRRSPASGWTSTRSRSPSSAAS